jgi:hypothetical protein
VFVIEENNALAKKWPSLIAKMEKKTSLLLGKKFGMIDSWLKLENGVET